MGGSTQYTVASTAPYGGTKCPHPDVSVGPGVDLGPTCLGAGGTMANLAAAMQGNPGFYSREALRDSDITLTNVGPGFGIISFYRDFPLSRLGPMSSVRSETVSGTRHLRFMNKQDARLCTLEQAVLSVGYPVGGLLADSYETGSDITILNTATRRSSQPDATWRYGAPAKRRRSGSF